MSQDLTRTDLEKQAQKRLFDVLKHYERSLKEVLPKLMTPERFVWLVINNIRTTPALLGCKPQSFINAVMLASNMGLEIRRNSAYLIPFGAECTLMIDYRGKMDLARRSGKIGAIALEPVRERDVFEYERNERGTHFRHTPYLWNKSNGKMAAVPDEERGEIVLGYSLAELTGQEKPQIDVMTLAQVEAIRRRSRSGRADLTLADIRATKIEDVPYTKRVPWLTDYDQMFRKTLAHRGANYWPQSSELALSQEVDDGAETGTQPVANGLEEFTAVLDPADNQPLVSIPEDSGGRKEAAAEVAEAKIELLKTGTPASELEAKLAESVQQVRERKAKKPPEMAYEGEWPHNPPTDRPFKWNGKRYEFYDSEGQTGFREVPDVSRTI